MRITHFFVIVFLFAASLLVFLEPQEYLKSTEAKIAQLEIEDFSIYEISKEGVQSVVSGTLARQYPTYYEVENVHYIENKNQLGEHIYADQGKFEKEVAYLDENVRYFREDGLSFESDHAVYNTKKELLHVPEKFILTQNENIIYGTELNYNVKTGAIVAKEIDANYYVEDKK